MILRRRDPERRMARFYRVILQPALLGGCDLVREWGRIGSPGTLRTDAFDSVDEAQAAADRLTARKKSTTAPPGPCAKNGRPGCSGAARM